MVRFGRRSVAVEELVIPAIAVALVFDALLHAWWSGLPATLAMACGVARAALAARTTHASRSIFVRRARVAPIAWGISAVLALLTLARAYVAVRQFQGGVAEEGTRSYDALYGALLVGSILVQSRRTDVARLALRLTSRPMLTLAASFAAMISGGTLLLVLPFSVRSIEDISFLDALFTMTSAVCVTGLTVNDVGTTYTVFGQAVILLGIQLGGIGMMTVAAFIFQFRGTAALRDQSRYAEMLGTKSLFALRSTLRAVVIGTLAVELAGALLLFLFFASDPRLGGRPVWTSLFTSVSAFCNAGFSLLPDGLTLLRQDALPQLVVMALVVTGGLGFPVLQELAVSLRSRSLRLVRREAPRPPRLGMLARVTLATSAVLIVAGAAGVSLLESGGVLEDLPLHDRLTGALFTSITARTAGFNTLDVGAMQAGTLLLLMLLMFIGGSPASTAGGIKTTTAAVLASTVRAEISGGEPSLFHRELAPEVRRRATAIAGLSGAMVFTALLLLTIVERDVPFLALAFEAVSAFSTTGLSTGVTASLSPLGKLVLIATMFVGRVGPLTIALAAGAHGVQRHRLAQTGLSVG